MTCIREEEDWEYYTLPINQLFILQILTLVHTFFTIIMSYLKSIEIILLLIALFIAIALHQTKE